MSTNAPTHEIQNKPKAAIQSRRERRAHYALVRSKTKHTGPKLAPWVETKLCVPNPRPGVVAVDPSKPIGPGNQRATVFGGYWDGTAIQRAQCIRGSCLEA